MFTNTKEKNLLTECSRCGTCCKQGGPALHTEDIQLIDNGILSFSQLITIRQNEPAHDPIQDKVLPSNSEFIKIRGKGNSWNCLFFDQANSGCLIYKSRALECRLLFCQDTGPLEKIMGNDLIHRQHLLPENDPVLPLIAQQELECPYQLINNLLASTDNYPNKTIDQLNDLVRNDLRIRDTFLRNFPERKQDELFIFGRPLFMLITPYGFRLVENENGVILEQINP
jgi:Fe-S-cluster containining protein